MRWLLLALVTTACTASKDQPPAASMAAFELVCDSADTDQSSTLFCMRIDTRDGDVRTVDLAKLPTSNGPTKGAGAAPGTFALVCDSTDTATKADFRCIRLNRQTGEMLLVNLPKVAKTPD